MRITQDKTILPASCRGSNSLPFLITLLALTISLALALPAGAKSLAKISTDTFTNSDSTHKTEVEPNTFAWGNTIVSALHVARRPGIIGWGSADVGFSTSTNGGVSWSSGSLPGLTVNYKSGTYGAAADPSVAYDGMRNPDLPSVGIDGAGNVFVVWSDCRFRTGCKENDIVMSSSSDGTTWSKVTRIPIDATSSTSFLASALIRNFGQHGSHDDCLLLLSDGGATSLQLTAGRPGRRERRSPDR